MKYIKNKLKKWIIVILVLSIIIYPMEYKEVLAQQKQESSNTMIITEQSDLEEIEQLFKKRAMLVLDYTKNKKDINQIDKKLQKLGVEFLSGKDVQKKFKQQAPNGVTSQAILPKTKGIQWTSIREITVYRGNEYELQLIRGVPHGNDSPLIQFDHKESKYSKGFKAGCKNVLTIGVKEIAGKVPKIGGSVSKAITFYDLCKGLKDGVTKTTTTIKGVDCTYDTVIGAEYLYIFIKNKGAKDLGNQIVGYAGNYATFETEVNFKSSYTENGKTKPKLGKKIIEQVL